MIGEPGGEGEFPGLGFAGRLLRRHRKNHTLPVPGPTVLKPETWNRSMSRPLRTFFFDGHLQGGIFDIPQPEAGHIASSLRLGPGDEIALTDGRGKRGVAEILEANHRRVRVRIRDVTEEHPAAAGTRLTLAVAVPKERRMDWLLEKCTELGVEAVVPTVFRHSVVVPRPGRHGKADKWNRVVLEASKQAGRATLMRVSDFMNVHDVLALEAELKIFLSPQASVPLPDLLDGPPPPSALVVVGPEGGTDLSEEKAALDRGFRKARLTRHVLRIETAAVAAAAVLLARAAP